MANSMLGWVLGCLLVYAALFGTGQLHLWANGPGDDVDRRVSRECNRSVATVAEDVEMNRREP